MSRLRHVLAFGVASFVFALAAQAQEANSPASPGAAAAARPAALADFDAYVDATRKQFDVPGIGVAIVKDGKTVLEMGSGVRKLGEPAKVDAHTQFAIASNTKAFTAASLSILTERFVAS